MALYLFNHQYTSCRSRKNEKICRSMVQQIVVLKYYSTKCELQKDNFENILEKKRKYIFYIL